MKQRKDRPCNDINYNRDSETNTIEMKTNGIGNSGTSKMCANVHNSWWRRIISIGVLLQILVNCGEFNYIFLCLVLVLFLATFYSLLIVRWMAACRMLLCPNVDRCQRMICSNQKEKKNKAPEINTMMPRNLSDEMLVNNINVNKLQNTAIRDSSGAKMSGKRREQQTEMANGVEPFFFFFVRETESKLQRLDDVPLCHVPSISQSSLLSTLAAPVCLHNRSSLDWR